MTQLSTNQEIQLRLLKQRVPLMVEHQKQKLQCKEARKTLYNIAWKLKELDDEILRLSINSS